MLVTVTYALVSSVRTGAKLPTDRAIQKHGYVEKYANIIYEYNASSQRPLLAENRHM